MAQLRAKLPKRIGKMKVKSASPSLAKDGVAGVTTSNDKVRTTLAGLGVKDPTKPKGPNVLERIGGVAEGIGLSPIRSLVHNATNAEADADVDVMEEWGKAFTADKDRLSGAHLAQDWGVQGKGAQFAVGLLADIVLDPWTYISLGWGAGAEAGGKAALTGVVETAAKEGALPSVKALEAVGASEKALALATKAGAVDDAGRIALDVLSESKEGLKASRAILDDLTRFAAKSGNAGGVKVLGQTVLPVQGAMTEAGAAISGGLRKLPGSQWAELAFHGGEEAADIYRQGNSLLTAAYDGVKASHAGRMKLAAYLGKEFEHRLAEDIPDARLRGLASVAIGDQLSDPRFLGEYRKGITEAAKLAKRGEDDAARLIMEDMERLRGTFLSDPTAIEARLVNHGVAGDELASTLAGIRKFQDRMGANLERQRGAGVAVGEFAGDSDVYLPGLAKTARSAKDERAYTALLDELGVDPAELVDPSRPKLSGLGKPGVKLGAKEYANPLARLQGERITGEVGKGLSTELDISRLGGYATTKAEQNVAYATLQREMASIFTGAEPEEITTLMGGVRKLFTNDEATNLFVRSFDRAQNLWKRAATLYSFPRFQARNLMSNKVLQWMNGLFDPTTEGEGARLAGKFISVGGDLGKLAPADRALMEELISHGVWQGAAEIAEQVGKPRVSALGQKFGDLNEFIENGSRIAAYLAAKKKGSAPAAAAEMVQKTLFNYDPAALTAFERNVMRRVMPFYVWTRRVMPELGRIAVTDPSKISLVTKLQQEGRAVNPELDESILPEYVRDSGPIATPFKDKAGNPVMLSTSGLFPAGELTRLDLSGKDVFGSLSPAIKMLVEITSNKEIWTGKDIAKYPKEKKRVVPGIEAFDDALDQIPALAPLNRAWTAFKAKAGIDERTTNGDTYLVADAYAMYLLKTMVPWFNGAGKIAAAAATDDESTRVRGLAQLTGLGLTSYDEESYARQKAYADASALSDARLRLRDEGQWPTAAPSPKKPAKKKIRLVKP